MPQTFLGQPPYEQADALAFVTRTGLPTEQVRQVLDAQAQYQVLLGLAPLDVLTEEQQAALQAQLLAHRDLLCAVGSGDAPGVCVWHLELEYITRTKRQGRGRT